MPPPLSDAKPIRSRRDDLYGRWPFAKAIADIVRDPRHSGLVTLGIEGAWGSGKSSVLQLVADELTRDRRHREVFVSAWRTTSQDQFLANLSYALATAIRRDWRGAGLRIAWARLKRQSLPTQVAIFTPLLMIGALVAFPEVRGWTKVIADNPKKWAEGVGIFGLPVLAYLASKLSQPILDGVKAMAGNIKADAIGAIERFASDFDVLAEAQPAGTRFVVLVEDLDRCAPSHVIDVLSAIAQLESHPKADRIAFLLAYDRGRLLQSIKSNLPAEPGRADASDTAQNYLDKVIQLELPLPDVSPVCPPPEPLRTLRAPVMARGALISLGLVAFLIAHVADYHLNRTSAWISMVVVALIGLEHAYNRLARSDEETLDPDGWDDAAAAAEPWLQHLTLRMKARVLNRARAALIMRPEVGLSSWDAVSISAVANRWPDQFGREELGRLRGSGPVDVNSAFRLQSITDTIKQMEEAGQNTSQFYDAQKLYAVVSTFKR